MRLSIAALAIAIAGSSAAQKPAIAPPADVTELAGRVPGKTQRCVGVEPGRLFSVSSSDPKLLLYDNGKTIWATKLDPKCEFVAGEPVIPDSNASYYCQGDIVRAGGRMTVLPFGRICTVGKFTAYPSAK